MSKFKVPWTFLKSTFIVIVISFLASLGVKTLGGNFWASFSLFFTIQYILFSFIASIAKNYFIQKTRQKELDVLEPLSTILECAYCNTSNIMTFLPDQNERAEFTCTSCNKTNLVNIQFTVARITEPVVVPNATGIPLQDEKQ
jgi:hypothetical protein